MCSQRFGEGSDGGFSDEGFVGDVLTEGFGEFGEHADGEEGVSAEGFEAIVTAATGVWEEFLPEGGDGCFQAWERGFEVAEFFVVERGDADFGGEADALEFAGGTFGDGIDNVDDAWDFEVSEALAGEGTERGWGGRRVGVKLDGSPNFFA